MKIGNALLLTIFFLFSVLQLRKQSALFSYILTEQNSTSSVALTFTFRFIAA